MPEDLIRLMRSLFLPLAETFQEAFWRPATDVYRTADGWLLKFDLAGVAPADVSLSVRGRCLTVRGCRRDWVADEGHSHYQLEIPYSHFERCVELPCDLEPGYIATEYRDGMLVVHVRRDKP